MNNQAPIIASKAEPATRLRAMVVVPCLNEAANIERLVESLDGAAIRQDMKMVIADGGSTDGTFDILARIAETNPRVAVVHNRRKLQGAGVNLAVREFGDAVDCVIRIDAHADYPDDFCDQLIEEAEITGADSVVVAMVTKGRSRFQRATAMAQNSKLGNGGSKHREGAKGQWIDHGHHALMRIEPFRAVGGYDESFGHNEDAELDHRLRAAGYRIWLTDKTRMIYYPRYTVSSLFRQYLNYGQGRARNILKHGTMPKLRQTLPALILPLTAGAMLALFRWWAAVPFSLWVVICLGYGIVLGIGHRDRRAFLASIAMIVMHFAWSAGFWLQMLNPRKRGKRTR